MDIDSVLTEEEEIALNEACESFGNRKYVQSNHPIRPKGVNIFDWLASEKNAEAFNEGRKIMEHLRTSDD